MPEHSADQWIQISLLCCLREVLRSWGLPAISAQSLLEGFDRLARSRATRPVPASAKRKVSVRRSSGSSSLGVAASRLQGDRTSFKWAYSESYSWTHSHELVYS